MAKRVVHDPACEVKEGPTRQTVATRVIVLSPSSRRAAPYQHHCSALLRMHTLDPVASELYLTLCYQKRVSGVRAHEGERAAGVHCKAGTRPSCIHPGSYCAGQVWPSDATSMHIAISWLPAPTATPCAICASSSSFRVQHLDMFTRKSLQGSSLASSMDASPPEPARRS